MSTKETLNLFERGEDGFAPLADRMRPRSVDEVVGQEDLLGPGRPLRRCVETHILPSLLFWGPPGSGKTTLARVLAHGINAKFVTLSAVADGLPELRKVLAAAKEQRNVYGKRTIVFIDEIHRFNKAQQDGLLPDVENGNIILIGATTENPSFALNSALLSRLRVYALKAIDAADLLIVLKRALADSEHGLAEVAPQIDEDALQHIAQIADGDARRALNLLESVVAQSPNQKIDLPDVQKLLSSPTLRYDKKGEEHYNVISAFIKSLRGSDADAAVYWMMRMLDAGEDPLFVLRRMIIFASEDIGNADPQALQVAVSADAAFQRLGMPEGLYPLSQACVYLAQAPKSNAIKQAWHGADADVKAYGSLPVPMKLRNAPTPEMKNWGYGEGYRYPHNEGGIAKGETYLPDKLIGHRYLPVVKDAEANAVKPEVAAARTPQKKRND